jgi:hypothetical protein
MTKPTSSRHGGGPSLALAAAALALVFCARGVLAQQQTGNVYGRVTDEQGVGLPGVSVTLSGIGAPVTTVTDARGDYRFLNLAPGSYSLTHALSGFQTLKRDGVVVAVGRNTELTAPMKIAGITTEMIVTTEGPILDTRKTTTGVNVSQAELTSIPTARDPWVILQSVPGVLVDRVNVGGNESGQQSNYIAKGSSPTSGVWSVDGVNITDVGAVGSSPTYYDFDSFQEMQVATGGSDVTQITSGANLNMVTKRGTNDVHGSARVFITDNRWEANASNDEAKAQGFASGNHVDNIQDYGVELGGPIVTDRLWLWGSYGRNQINLRALSTTDPNGIPDRTTLEDINAKMNAQIVDNNSATLFFLRGDKIKLGRNASPLRPPETTWDQTGPTSVYKLEDSHIFSPNLFATALASYVDGGFRFDPEGGLSPYVWRGADNINHGSYLQFDTVRPQAQFTGTLNAFARTGELGHEFKAGFTYRTAPVSSSTVWPHDVFMWHRSNGVDRVRIFRESNVKIDTTFYQAFLSDTITFKNLTINAGVRYDQQQGHNRASTSPANETFPDIVPAVSTAESDPVFKWKNFSPRVGITYALGPDTSKTLIRASYGRFVDNLGAAAISFNSNTQYGYLRYRWTDQNGDNVAQRNEVNFNSLQVPYNINPNCVTCPNPNRVDPDLKSPTTDEFVLGVEKEAIPGIAVSLTGTYRKYKNFNWTPYFGENADGSIHVYGSSDWLPYTPESFPSNGDTLAGGFLTGTDPNGQAYSVPIYELCSASQGCANPTAPDPTGGRYLTNLSGYSQEYKGFEFQVTKRYSKNWSARAGFSYNDWTQNGGQAAAFDPTNQLNIPVYFANAGPSAVSGGQVLFNTGQGSGAKQDVYINSKWQMNVNALYTLPLGFSVAGNFFARQGYPRVLEDQNYQSFTGRFVVVNDPSADRLPTVTDLDLRLAKDIKVGPLGVSLSIDVFNVFNRNVVLQRKSDINSLNGTLPDGSNGLQDITEIQAPRVARFGARVTF